MARSLPAGMVTAAKKRFTNPIYLLSQDMGAAILYSSSRELVDYNGNDYVPSLGLRVDSVSNDTLEWSLDNSDRAISIMALANTIGGNTVTLYLHYEGETITRFTGVIDEWRTAGQRVSFSATSQASRAQFFPNERAQNGTFNHLPAPGTNIMWGSQTIILESEQT